MTTLTTSYFEIIPNDLLQLIFSFIDSLKDSFSLLLISKRCNYLIRTKEIHWKSLCLKFWKEHKQQLTQQTTNDYSLEGEYELESVQKESGKEWFWISQCFVNGRVYGIDSIIMIGPTPVINTNNWGILVNPKYITTIDHKQLNLSSK